MTKYRAKRTELDGMQFDSKREAERWQQLKLLEKAGIVKNLQRQVTYECWVNSRLICKYRADYVYDDAEKGHVIEDAKGFRTPVYRMKRKLVEACHGINILET